MQNFIQGITGLALGNENFYIYSDREDFVQVLWTSERYWFIDKFSSAVLEDRNSINGWYSSVCIVGIHDMHIY